MISQKELRERSLAAAAQAESNKSGEEMLQELLDKAGTKERRAAALFEERYTKVIDEDVLTNRLVQPAKRVIQLVVFALSAAALTGWLPYWRYTWRQRKFFHKFCEGRAIDLMPIVGDETRVPLLEYSRAISIDLAGRAAVSATQQEQQHQTETVEPVPPPPRHKGVNSIAYQVDEFERREDAAAAAAAEAERKGLPVEEQEQDVSLAMLQEACRPDTQMGLSSITFRAVDRMHAQERHYDTAFITDALCWEDPSVAQGRLRHAWSLLKPGGTLMVSDFGRPRIAALARLADWVESKQVASLRLTLDYVEYMRQTFGDEIEWPPRHDERTSLTCRYTVALRKKPAEEPEPKGGITQDSTTKKSE